MLAPEVVEGVGNSGSWHSQNNPYPDSGVIGQIFVAREERHCQNSCKGGSRKEEQRHDSNRLHGHAVLFHLFSKLLRALRDLSGIGCLLLRSSQNSLHSPIVGNLHPVEKLWIW